MNTPPLKLDWCSAEAARYACLNWHYSRKVPVFKLVRVGVWEQGRFVGCVLFGSGATPEIGTPFGLKQTEVCELVRVALDKHAAPVSRIVAIAVRMLRKQSPGLRLIVSFADQGQGHVGGIYKAGGWLYLGHFTHHTFRVNGETVHPKTLHSRYGKGGQSIPWLRANVDPNAARIVTPPKHKYVMPLDDATRVKLAPVVKPYPRAPYDPHRVGSIAGDAPANQAGQGGSTPTPTLAAGSA